MEPQSKVDGIGRVELFELFESFGETNPSLSEATGTCTVYHLDCNVTEPREDPVACSQATIESLTS
jgi:hypothetical protein